MGKALFVAIEGLDGSGQSTQRKLLKNWFEKQGQECIMTKEPTSRLVGGLIRAQLTGAWSSSPRALQLLFSADREIHLNEEVVPALEKGVHVITDRYFFSSIAYGMLDLEKDWLQEVNSKFLMPDVTVYLDVSPSECLRRITGDRMQLELFEKEELLTEVRENYLELSKEYEFSVVNGEKPVEEVHEEIIKLIKNKIC